MVSNDNKGNVSQVRDDQPRFNNSNNRQFTLQEVLGCAVQIGWPKEMAEEYFLRRDSVGWIDAAHRPIRNLSSDMRLWQLREYIKPKAKSEMAKFLELEDGQ